MRGLGTLVLVLALIPWMAQNYVASLAITKMTAQTTLRGTFENNDARLRQAFATARRQTPAHATLVTQPHHPGWPTHDALLTVTAGSKRETIDALTATSAAIRTDFARAGRGQLIDVGDTPRATPLQNARSLSLRKICRQLALAILCGGLLAVAYRLVDSGLPKPAIFATAGGLIAIALLFFGGPLLWIPGLPIALLVLVVVVTRRVHRAAKWEEAPAHITTSKVIVKHHQFSGEKTQLINTPSVAYDFSVGDKLFHGHRISLGFAPADGTSETLKRYPLGATVPVFYDPTNPEESVLERKPPASLGCIRSGAIAVVLAYGAVLFLIGHGESPSEPLSVAFQKVFPRTHHPLALSLLGLFGLLCLGSWLWNRRHVRAAFPSVVTKGRIVSSKSETYVAPDGVQSGSQHRYYHALVEFAYTVDGQEYHNTVTEPSTTKSAATAEAARYIADTKVAVHYDPQDPTHSTLEANTMKLDGRASLVVGVICVALAIYLALP